MGRVGGDKHPPTSPRRFDQRLVLFLGLRRYVGRPATLIDPARAAAMRQSAIPSELARARKEGGQPMAVRHNNHATAEHRGYNTEICTLLTIGEVEIVAGAPDD